MRTPKENKQKPRNRTPKSTAGTIPKAALKAAWIKAKEQTRTAARENDTESRQQEPTDLAGSAAEQTAAFVRRQGRKLAETQTRQHRQKEAAAHAHAASERGVSPKQTECGTLPDADPCAKNTACRAKGCGWYRQNSCGGALGSTAFSCRPAQSCRGHCCRD